MMKLSVVLVACILAVGCVPSSGMETASSNKALTRAAVTWESCVTIPETPSCPPRLDLSDWAPGRRFYPTQETLSARTIIMQSPEDRNRFWAYGFDVRQLRCHFFVDGIKERHYNDFASQIHDDYLDIRRVGIADVNLGSDGDTDLPPPPPPPAPPIDQAFRAAYVSWMAIEAWRQ